MRAQCAPHLSSAYYLACSYRTRGSDRGSISRKRLSSTPLGGCTPKSWSDSDSKTSPKALLYRRANELHQTTIQCSTAPALLSISGLTGSHPVPEVLLKQPNHINALIDLGSHIRPRFPRRSGKRFRQALEPMNSTLLTIAALRCMGKIWRHCHLDVCLGQDVQSVLCGCRMTLSAMRYATVNASKN